MSVTSVTPEQARRIAVRAQALDGSATGGLLELVRQLGFLQMDPIAVVARPEHLVLYSRLGRIDAGELERLIWQERKLVEWDAFIWPVEDMPILLARMRRHRTKPRAWVGDYLKANARFRRQLLRELELNGPVVSRQLTDDRGATGSGDRWWGTGQLRLMLDLLQARGEVAVAGRRGTTRVWDLAERVYPRADPLPWREAQALMEEKRRRSLGVWLERAKLRAYDDIPDDPVPPRLTFLSPFDRLIHDRARAKAIFSFDYRLEMYVPRDKRKFGYYVLPILRGEHVVGRIELTRDKSSNTLRVLGLWWEQGVKPLSLTRELRRLEREVASV